MSLEIAEGDLNFSLWEVVIMKNFPVVNKDGLVFVPRKVVTYINVNVD